MGGISPPFGGVRGGGKLRPKIFLLLWIIRSRFMRKNQFSQASRTGDMFSYGRVPTTGRGRPGGAALETRHAGVFLKALAANVPDLVEQNGWYHWIQRGQKHGKKMCMLYISTFLTFWTSLPWRACDVPPVPSRSLLRLIGQIIGNGVSRHVLKYDG